MNQAIVLLLDLNKKIEDIRKKYHPDYEKFKPHLTLVYPFEFNDQAVLSEHIKKSIKYFSPFKISLRGLKRSVKDFYLYLLVEEGKDILLNLYSELNSRILSDFKNKDLPVFIPHLSLGIFDSAEEIDNVIEDIKKEDLCFETKVDSLQLLSLNKDSSISSVKNFSI